MLFSYQLANRLHGFVSLAELSQVKGRLGLPFERDHYFTAEKPLSAHAEEARIKGRLVA